MNSEKREVRQLGKTDSDRSEKIFLMVSDSDTEGLASFVLSQVCDTQSNTHSSISVSLTNRKTCDVHRHWETGEFASWIRIHIITR